MPRRPCLAAALAASLALAPHASAAPSPRPFAPGFIETVVAGGFDSPVSMAFAPDGRVFVCEQGGALRVIRQGRVLPRPFWTAPTHADTEEGLLGVAFDPDFASNGFVYVCYTALVPARHQRISRLVAMGDTAKANAEVVLLELDENHNHLHVGGALRFGRDGMLYAGTGDNDLGDPSQSLHSTFGKLLRIRPDGTIPADNPFVHEATGRYRAIWARGLRNAFTLDVQPGTGRLFVNDVGGSEWEEVDEAAAGANYGWPAYEGPSGSDGFRLPVHAYRHSDGCAITGGAFYGPAKAAFGRDWVGRYFYAEYCRNEIRWIDPANAEAFHVFGVTHVAGPVDLRVGPDGCLYVLARGNSGVVGGEHSSSGSLLRISPGNVREH